MGARSSLVCKLSSMALLGAEAEGEAAGSTALALSPAQEGQQPPGTSSKVRWSEEHTGPAQSWWLQETPDAFSTLSSLQTPSREQRGVGHCLWP